MKDLSRLIDGLYIGTFAFLTMYLMLNHIYDCWYRETNYMSRILYECCLHYLLVSKINGVTEHSTTIKIQ